MSSTQALEFVRTVKVSPSQVYRAFTNATALREWCCDDAQADPRPGGRLYLYWNVGYYASGEFTALEPDKMVAFTWHGRAEPAATQVQVTLEAQDGGTVVTLKHDGMGSDETWTEMVQEVERGWTSGLENLQSMLETGMDLRLYRRPMLGIVSGQDLNDEIAAELGVPVVEGIRITGVVEGMGAQTAGLQSDDVLTSIGGRPTADFQALNAALDPHQAGDRVEVIFYRGNERKSVTMELSRRPAPDVPPSAEALAEAVRAVHTELDAELDEIFKEVSEAEAAQRPAADEWSASQVVAHLVATERAAHVWISSLLRGYDLNDWGTNLQPRVSAAAAVYKTVPELLAALKRDEAETEAMLAALPEDFVARKSSYVRMGYMFLTGLAYHSRLHFDQIRAALEVARKK